MLFHLRGFASMLFYWYGVRDDLIVCVALELLIVLFY